MTIDFQTDENDFLTHQLFVASKSERVKKRRLRSKLALSIIYTAFGLLFLFDEKKILGILFLVIALLWFFVYPLWVKRRYINFYKGFLNEKYKNRFGKNARITFSDDYIFASDNGSESKIKTTEVEEINEIPTIIFVHLKGGQSFILPKDKISNIDDLKLRLKELAEFLNINYTIDEKWEWK